MGVVAAMLCVASSAFAAPGLNLSWTTCAGEAGQVNNKTFACASNTGNHLLVVSFELAADLATVTGNELVIDFLTQQPTLPAWWDMKTAGTCRAASLLFNTTANGGDVVCVDWAAGASVGGIGAYDDKLGSISPSLQASHRRLVAALAVPGTSPVDLVSATEYFSANVTINSAKTVGTGSCAGCTEPMCIVLNSVKCTTPIGPNDVTLGNASSPGSNIVTWQGAGPDCSAVPVRNTTWGRVKAMYR
jgi:hypothetical protein